MAHASADPRTGVRVEAGCYWLLCLPRGADQQRRAGELPPLCDRPMAALASGGGARRIEGRGSAWQCWPTTGFPSRASFSSMADRSLCRQTPEVEPGASRSWALRSDLCGGRAVMRVPRSSRSDLRRTTRLARRQLHMVCILIMHKDDKRPYALRVLLGIKRTYLPRFSSLSRRPPMKRVMVWQPAGRQKRRASGGVKTRLFPPQICPPAKIFFCSNPGQRVVEANPKAGRSGVRYRM